MTQYIDKDATVAEINRLIAELVEKGEGTMFEQGRISAFEDAKLFLDTLEVKEVDLQEEPKTDWLRELQDKIDSLSKEDFEKVMTKYSRYGGEGNVDYNKLNTMLDESLSKETKESWNKRLGEEPVSEDLDKEMDNYLASVFNKDMDGGNPRFTTWFKALQKTAIHFANWQKENLWKPADGDDLPIFDREVIVLIKYNAQRNIHDEEYPTYRVGFGHRPNPDGWDGKNIDTNEVTHYTPKLYGKGGWNAPDIVYWLDCLIPKEIEL